MPVSEIGLWAGFILTLLVFSAVLGDNILYRLAVYVFVGMSAGYAAIVTWNSVLVPWIRSTILSGEPLRVVLGVIPLALGGLLLFKSSTRLNRLAGLTMALLIGVGTAVALIGATSGTLVPLTLGATRPGLDLPSFLVSIAGVVCSLVYFQYLAVRTADGGSRRSLPISTLAFFGQGFIVITLGALYAAAILSSLAVFSDRVAYVLEFLKLGGG
ncbi:MAG: hypothetical protein IPM16_02905 [Chloroflexi bacterium]|nr:hypothetical protein [Chloroflexota bacterium]